VPFTFCFHFISCMAATTNKSFMHLHYLSLWSSISHLFISFWNSARVSCIYTIWAYDLQSPTCSYLFGIRVVVFCHDSWQSFTSVIQLSSIIWTLICTIPTESLDEKLNASIWWPPPWGFLAKIHVLDQLTLNVQFLHCRILSSSSPIFFYFGESEPTPVEHTIVWMDGIWTGNTFSLYSCPITNSWFNYSSTDLIRTIPTYIFIYMYTY
jgi:hypothetical protein